MSPVASERPSLIVVAGRPGAGKGTQCARIAAEVSAAHLSLGDALRQHVARGTPLGLEVRPFVDAGRLVPDRFALDLIDAQLERERLPMVLLDGFPRNLAQAEALECRQPGAVSLAVLLAVPLTTVAERLRSRGRPDDDEPTLRERFASFEHDTKPMLTWYERRGSLVVIDADQPHGDVTVAVKALLARSHTNHRHPATALGRPAAGSSLFSR